MAISPETWHDLRFLIEQKLSEWFKEEFRSWHFLSNLVSYLFLKLIIPKSCGWSIPSDTAFRNEKQNLSIGWRVWKIDYKFTSTMLSCPHTKKGRKRRIQWLKEEGKLFVHAHCGLKNLRGVHLWSQKEGSYTFNFV